MNTKKMSTEQLQEEVEISKGPFQFEVSDAEREFWNACKAELARRWGIKL